MTQPFPGRRLRYPLFSMWIWPQAAIRDLVARENPVAILVLSGIAGAYLTILLVAVSAPGVGAVLHLAALFAIGAAGGIGGLYVCGALMRLAGVIVDGHATQRELRRALAWTSIPNIFVVTLIAVPGLVVAVYAAPNPHTDWEGLVTPMVLVSPLGFWGMFATVRAIGAGLKVGVLRAILCIMLVGGVTGYAMAQLAGVLDRKLPSSLMPNDAMLPTIQLAERFLHVPVTAMQRGDIVLFTRVANHPSYGVLTRRYVKRVIGLPGDVIAMTGGVLSVNGKTAKRQRMADFGVSGRDGQIKLTPHFLETLPNGVTYGVIDSEPNRTLGGEYRVAADQILVLGDNRDNTDDMEDIRGDTHQRRPVTLVWLDRVYAKAAVSGRW